MRFCRLASILAALVGGTNLAWANNTIWIDVASPQDYALEHVVDAVHIPHTHIARSVSADFPDKTTSIKLYDRDQHQAVQAQEALQALGYEQVSNSGNLVTLKEQGQATVQSEPLSQHEQTLPHSLLHSLPHSQPSPFSEPQHEALAKTPSRER